jgi:hypothetical protein
MTHPILICSPFPQERGCDRLIDFEISFEPKKMLHRGSRRASREKIRSAE